MTFSCERLACEQGSPVPELRGGLVIKAHRLVYHSTLGWRGIKKKKKSTWVADTRGAGRGSVRAAEGVYVVLGHMLGHASGPEEPFARPGRHQYRKVIGGVTDK